MRFRLQPQSIQGTPLASCCRAPRGSPGGHTRQEVRKLSRGFLSFPLTSGVSSVQCSSRGTSDTPPRDTMSCTKGSSLSWISASLPYQHQSPQMASLGPLHLAAALPAFPVYFSHSSNSSVFYFPNFLTYIQAPKNEWSRKWRRWPEPRCVVLHFYLLPVAFGLSIGLLVWTSFTDLFQY